MSDHPSLSDLDSSAVFADRHIGPSAEEQATMLEALGFEHLNALMEAAVPGGIRSADERGLPRGAPEQRAPRELRVTAARNNPLEPMIGLGYSGTLTPAV